MNLEKVWELDSIFPGGSASAAFRDFLHGLETVMRDTALNFEHVSTAITSDSESATALLGIYKSLETTKLQIKEADGFVECLLLQDTTDTIVTKWRDEVFSLQIGFDRLLNSFRNYLHRLNNDAWARLLESTDSNTKTSLMLIKEGSDSTVSPQTEEMISSLSVTGFHAWESMYNQLISRMYLGSESRPFLEALQMSMVNPDREVRKHLYLDCTKKSEKESPIFASILNNIAGYRLEADKHRGRHSPISQAASDNRIDVNTIETAMGVVIERAKEFRRYFLHKSKLLNIENFGLYDIAMQINRYSQQFPIHEAADLIASSIAEHLPALGVFARTMFDQHWIDSEDRTNKSFAIREVYFPFSKQARVTVRYNHQFSLLPLLAHEIGHAYHDGLTGDQPGFLQDVPLSLAETASTFTEFLMLEGARRHIQDKEGRLGLLENKIQTALINLVLIPIRYLFEREFYERRKSGPVSVSVINELMVTAQRQVLGDGLEAYDPYLWMSTRHFYFTKTPFYNFPYVVGHCISNTFFSRLSEPGLLDVYDSFLRESGQYSVERLVAKHLQEDITKEPFWERAYEEALRDVDEFIQLTNNES